MVREGQQQGRCRPERALALRVHFGGGACLALRRTGLSIADIARKRKRFVLLKPTALTSEGDGAMHYCGYGSGYLAGRVGRCRRAAKFFLTYNPGRYDPLTRFDWVSLFALAVNERTPPGPRGNNVNERAPGDSAVLAYYHGSCLERAEGEFPHFLTPPPSACSTAQCVTV